MAIGHASRVHLYISVDEVGSLSEFDFSSVFSQLVTFISLFTFYLLYI